ncbi:hypothetical protein WJX82_007257 [Trebouxia sp. C0006]
MSIGPQCTILQLEPYFSGQPPFGPAAPGSALVRQRQTSCSRRVQARGLPLQHTGREPKRRPIVASRGSDPFIAAGSRLQSLLSGIGDGEEEVLESYLSEQAPETKMSLSLLAGGVMSSGALALCWLTGSDPWGGASVSFHSLVAATLGAAACVPLLMLRAAMWTSEARLRFPVLEELQRWQAEQSSSIVRNLSAAQMAVLVCCDVLPTTVMTLPAAQGGLTASFQIYASHIRDWGVSVPEMGPPVAALGVTALLAAGARLFEHATTQEEYEVVATAMENADRYYRVMTNGVSGTAKDPDNAAKAFKAVASQWLQQRQQACTVLAALTAAEVLFLGLLWRMTGDMAAPLTAAMMMTSVEYAFVRKLTDAGMKHDR